MDPSAEWPQSRAAHSQPSELSEFAAQSSLKTLRIDWSEVEHLSGLEANELWVGNLWAGAHRLNVLRRSPLSFLCTELLIVVLAGMVSLPLGLLLVRNPASAGPEAARAAFPFAIALAVGTASLLLLRYRCMAKNRTRWRSLLAILDEIDRYHDSLKAFELLGQLQEIQTAAPIPPFSSSANDVSTTQVHLDPAICEALMVTRDSLVTGLLADRILRQQRTQGKGRFQRQLASRSRYSHLIEHLDQNLVTLMAFDVNQQVTEEAQLLQNALQISAAVRRNMTR